MILLFMYELTGGRDDVESVGGFSFNITESFEISEDP